MLNSLPISDSGISPESLVDIIHELSELLPSQGPIDVFIHHNTLHGLEHLSFFDALEEGAKIFEARAYLDESRYLASYHEGRITNQDLEQAILSLAPKTTNTSEIIDILLSVPEAKTVQQVKWSLREAFITIPDHQGASIPAYNWLDAKKWRNQLKFLEKINRQASISLQEFITDIIKHPERYDVSKEVVWISCLLNIAEFFLEQQPETIDQRTPIALEYINPFLIRFCEEYLDLGQATVAMPNRDHGMLPCFYDLVRKSALYLPKWLQPILGRIDEYEQLSATEIILLHLKQHNYNLASASQRIRTEALALKGWAGFISAAEHNVEYLHGLDHLIKPKLVDYLALRLILSDLAEDSQSAHQQRNQDLASKEQRKNLDQIYHLALHLMQLVIRTENIAQLLGSEDQLGKLAQNLLKLSAEQRQRYWHIAFEENLYQRALTALAANKTEIAPQTGRIQMVFCLDDREESIRRHLELLDPDIQTFGTAGFFGIDAIYHSISGEVASQCPVLVKPTHIVRERAKNLEDSTLSKIKRRQSLNLQVNHYLNKGTGSIISGWLITLSGALSLIPMIISILFPAMRKPFSKFFDLDGLQAKDLSELEIEINDQDEVSSEMTGYSGLEMAERVASVLKSIGLTNNFGELLVVLGHGSSSRNNPLRSAYDCGACGGRPGRMNARAFAKMFNNQTVRRILFEKFEITIPETTYCIGAYHNTCNDQVQYYDLDNIPDLIRPLFERMQVIMKSASQNNSLERCRRFGQVNVSSPSAAYREVQSRSQTLAEPRPEYGHATNALCFVGKRSETKNLFLDRRAFLVSYDYHADPEATILTNIMKAVVPVCGGINLEYFFSALDNEVYGAGSKLPHNIVSMLGLMNGTCSDLRTGLPLQMVEIHEPVRLLIVVSCTVAQLTKVIKSDPTVERLISGQWVRLASHNPETGIIMEYNHHGEFQQKHLRTTECPIINDWRTHIDHRHDNLEFVRLR